MDTTSIPATPQQAVARTLKALKHYRQYSDGKIAARAGMGRSRVQSKMSGTSGLDAEEVFLLAAALDVEPYVLYMPRNDAIRWALDHPPTEPPDGPDGAPVIDLRMYACTRRPSDNDLGRTDQIHFAA